MSFYDTFDGDVYEMADYGIEIMPDRKSDYRDRTEDFLKMVTRPIPKSMNEGGIQYLGIGIEGLMGSGKSTLVMLALDKIVDHYGDDMVNSVYTKCINGVDAGYILQRMIEELDEKPVQYLIIDDALFLMGSDKKDRVLKQWFSDIRHAWEDVVKGKTGKDLLVGLINVVLIYQERYDMNSRVRNYLRIQINMEVGSERWYLADSDRTYGVEAVDDMINEVSSVAYGDYSVIGKGLMLAPFKDRKRISTGSVYFPLGKDDTRKLSDVVTKVIDLKKEKYTPTDVSTKKTTRVTSSDVWEGLDTRMVEKFLGDMELRNLYLSEEYIGEGMSRWRIGNKGFASDFDFNYEERMKLFIWIFYYKMAFEVVVPDLVTIRKKLGKLNLGSTSAKNYYSKTKSFWQKVEVASNRLGVWFEEWFTEKFRFVVRQMIKGSGNEERKRKLMGLSFVQDEWVDKKKPDIVVKNKGIPILFINVKNVLSHAGNHKPTPERKLSFDHNCKYAVLMSYAEPDPIQLKFKIFDKKSGSETVNIGHLETIQNLEDVIELILDLC